MIDSAQIRELAGYTVKGSDDDKLGKVVDVYESTDGAEGTFVTVSTGLFGNHSSFIPLREARLDGEELHVPYSKDVVKDAPRVADDAELTAEEEDRLYSHYGLDALETAADSQDDMEADAADADTDTDAQPVAAAPVAESAPPAPPAPPAPAAVRDDGTMTVSEERLRVGTERRSAGRARLRKYVVTETQTVTVPVTREELRIEREPLTDGDSDGELVELTDEEQVIVLSEEVPVVTTETVPVERIRVGTQTVTTDETVTEQVRKERVDLEDERE